MQNRSYFFLLILFVCSTLFGQQGDTLFVQTLTYDSSGRSGIYHFPDSTEGPFEKILMYYGMRCHDAAVGNGNIGCREWDYSCNTLILDSSRTDSTLKTHPDYKINNYTEDYFPWKQSVTHHYIERFYRFGTLKNGGSKTYTELTGTPAQSIMFSGDKTPTKHVWSYTASSLQKAGLTAGKIYGLRLPFEQNGSIKGVHISMKWLAPGQDLETQALSRTQLSRVFFGDIEVLSGKAHIIFEEPIEWDGSAHLALHVDVPKQNTNHFMIKAVQSPQMHSLKLNQDQQPLWITGAQWLDIPASSSQSLDSAITISFWAYGFPPYIPRQNTTLLEAVDTNNQKQLNIHLPWNNGEVYWDCGGNNTGYDRIHKKALTKDVRGQWNHWVFTKDVSAGIMRIYLNGVKWLEGKDKYRPIGQIDRFVFGMSVNHKWHYNGRVRDFAVWSKALPKDQIEIIAQNPLQIAEVPLLYYTLQNKQQNIQDLSGHGYHTRLLGNTESYYTLRRGEYFIPADVSFQTNAAPPIALITGNPNVEKKEIRFLDTIPNIKHMVVHYKISDRIPTPIDTQFLYNALEEPVYNTEGEQIDYVDIEDYDGEIEIETLRYYKLQPASFELLSLVTPYGNGLNLGPKGVYFTFDVSDFEPVLQGDKKLSVIYGAQQEELDIRFAFIKGIPVRKVLDISNVWPAGRGYFDQITKNEVFEPRQMSLRDDTDRAKVRLTVTGHQQNGEFVKKNHFLNVNGGQKEFNWDVWKECSTIPIYPQGGTWLLDRAGWCPGDPSLTVHHTITPQVKPGTTFELDYGVNGLGILKEANYLVASHLVQYGPPLKNLDIELSEVIRPSNRVEYLRLNPDCVSPEIKVRNTGKNPVSGLTIRYGVRGGQQLTTTWKGQLEQLESTRIFLPVTASGFWKAAVGQDKPVFDVEIIAVNGRQDDYLQNNVYHEPFTVPDIIENNVIRFEYKTNDRGEETSYVLTDRNGNILYSADSLENNTLYKDLLDLNPGCYSLRLDDKGDDGLYFWYWERVDPRGRGFAKLTYERTPEGKWRTLKGFNPDFGRFIKYDFAFQNLNSIHTPDGVGTLISLWPNPVIDKVHIKFLSSLPTMDIRLVLRDVLGRTLQQMTMPYFSGNEEVFELDVSNLTAGQYFVEVIVQNKAYVTSFIK